MLGRDFALLALVVSSGVVGCDGRSVSDDGSESGGSAAGGSASGGSSGSAVGGASSGGASGSATGGSSTGGASGSATGGSSTGGASGSATGGSSTGGAGGSATGGSSSGGGGGLPPDFTSCDVPSDCVLAANSCCVCGMPELSNMTAVNVESATEYFQSICPTGQICECATFLNPNLLATCDNGVCRAVDVRKDPASACTDATDCRVRVRECCECGGDTTPGSLIAVIRGGNAYSELVCDPQTGCAACIPSYPPEASTRCDAGHCVLVDGRVP